jgi:hypothetical protein
MWARGRWSFGSPSSPPSQRRGRGDLDGTQVMPGSDALQGPGGQLPA